MGRKDDRKKTGIHVKVLDFTKITDKAQKQHAEDKDFPLDMVEAYISGKMGYVEMDGDKFLLTDEGILLTKPASSDDFLVADVYVRTRNQSSGWTMPLFPIYSIPLTIEALDELTVSREEVLHDFVRSFGSRLECNYQGCVEFFEGQTLKAKVKAEAGE